MTHDCVRRDAPFRTLFEDSEQKPVLGLFGYGAIDAVDDVADKEISEN
jgi:hypothetical protein